MKSTTGFVSKFDDYSNFPSSFFSAQANRYLAYTKAGLNPIAADKSYNNQLYGYYKSASYESNVCATTTLSNNRSKSAYMSPTSPSGEMRMTRTIV